MRIHTNLTNLTPVRIASGAPIYFETHDEHGSRTHARSFEIRLGGSGGRNNTGMYGAGAFNGATWDEWGAFFGALFDADPDARAGGTSKRPVYANADHFNFETGDRFKGRNISTSTEPSSPDYLRTTHMPRRHPPAAPLAARGRRQLPRHDLPAGLRPQGRMHRDDPHLQHEQGLPHRQRDRSLT